MVSKRNATCRCLIEIKVPQHIDSQAYCTVYTKSKKANWVETVFSISRDALFLFLANWERHSLYNVAVRGCLVIHTTLVLKEWWAGAC